MNGCKLQVVDMCGGPRGKKKINDIHGERELELVQRNSILRGMAYISYMAEVCFTYVTGEIVSCDDLSAFSP